MQRKMRNDSEVEIALKWEVSKEYWIKERGLTEEEYEKVIRGCTCSSPGFCESCMGNDQCEINAIGFEKWKSKIEVQ
jgi:hypothetical protein